MSRVIKKCKNMLRIKITNDEGEILGEPLFIDKFIYNPIMRCPKCDKGYLWSPNNTNIIECTSPYGCDYIGRLPADWYYSDES